MQGATILLVDDQLEVLEPVRERVTVEGYDVVTARTGTEAVQRFRAADPDLVVLDLMLPQIDGLTVCRRIRSHSDVPILILSARSEETDMIAALEMGADDYLSKPYRMNELLARMRALLRRRGRLSAPRESEDELRSERITIHLRTRETRVDDRLVELTPTDFRLLSELVRRAGEVVTRDELLQAVWGYDGHDPKLVNTHIKRIRERIERDPSQPEVLLTVWGFGYKVAGLKSRPPV
ncbi:MAG: response regulator [Armatimonadota bacterium]